jgi:predicted GNAT superfamily acetyltransferase
MSIQYRHIITPEEIEQAVDLHGLIWFTDDRDAIPAHFLLALQHAGGLLLGAFDQDLLTGFVVGFQGVRDSQVLHWSHVTGVLPAYQGRGIGYELKIRQRLWALEKGYECIAWTFDPLQRGNARFNFEKLGCVCNHYHIDFYGPVSDGLNIGLPTDRFEVRWWLTPHERQQSNLAGVSWQNLQPVLSANDNGSPGQPEWANAGARFALVEIPDNINQLRETDIDRALNWRHSTRSVFIKLFEMGYTVVAFKQIDAHHFYILEQRTA